MAETQKPQSGDERKAQKALSDRAYYIANRERIIARAGRWQRENRNKRLAITRSYHERFKDDPQYKKRRCEQQKRHRRKNPEAVRASEKKWAASNPEKVKATRMARAERQPWVWLVHSAKSRAAKMGLAFSLTKEWAQERYHLGSALSGIQFVRGKGKLGPYSASIDRIDNAQGYTPENCRLVLYAENSFKQSMADEEMFVIARRMLALAG